MLQLNDISLMLGIQMLLNNNMEQLEINIKIFRNFYKSFKDYEIFLPKDSKPQWTLEEWNKKLDAHLKNLELELLNFHQTIIKIISNPLKFNELYQYATSILKKVNEFSAENFLVSKECREEFEKIAKIAVPMLPILNQAKTLFNLDLSTTWMDTSKKMGEVYHLFLQRLLFAAISHLSLYFDKIFREYKINLEEGESFDSIVKKVTEASKNNSALKKILIEFKLTNSIVINPPFMENFHLRHKLFNAVKSDALEIDEDLKHYNEIQRINYLQQILDPTNNYIPGYCAFDALTWLKNNEEQSFSTQILKEIDNYQDFQSLKWSFPASRVDFLQANLQLSKEFIIFGYHNPETKEEDNAKKCSDFFQALYKNLSIAFNEKRITNISLKISNSKSGHAVGIKKQENGYYFRDVNQGTFQFKTLKGFFKWLPNYFSKMGYEEYSSFEINFLPNKDLGLYSDPFYNFAYHNILRIKPIINDSSNYVKKLDEFSTSLDILIQRDFDDKFNSLLGLINNAMIHEKEQWSAILQADEMTRSVSSNDIFGLLKTLGPNTLISFYKQEDFIIPDILKEEARMLSFIEAAEDIFSYDNSDDENEQYITLEDKFRLYMGNKIDKEKSDHPYIDKIPKLLAEFSDLSKYALYISLQEIHQTMSTLLKNKDTQASLTFKIWELRTYRLLIIETTKQIQNRISLEICYQKVQQTLMLTEEQQQANGILYQYGHEYGGLTFKETSLIAEYCGDGFQKTDSKLSKNCYQI